MTGRQTKTKSDRLFAVSRSIMLLATGSFTAAALASTVARVPVELLCLIGLTAFGGVLWSIGVLGLAFDAIEEEHAGDFKREYE